MIFGVYLPAVFLIIIFMPTLIAFSRHLKHKNICFWTNLFLGWTIIFWIPLLVWSMFSKNINIEETYE